MATDRQEKAVYSVGELAKKVGVSVRTLQYYDRTGLLKASLSEGGRRTYTREDVLRLQQILFLKTFGFSLEEIQKNVLKSPSASSLEKTFTGQRRVLGAQIENLQQIIRLLDTLLFEIKKGREIDFDQLMTIMYMMRQGSPYAFVLSYFSSEQLKDTLERFQKPDRQGKNQEFVELSQSLFADLNTLYRSGADPSGPEGQELAGRWWDMVTCFTQGDPELLKTLISAGSDIQDWPEESREFRGAVEHFLSAALSLYLSEHQIDLSKGEAEQNE